MKHLKTTAFALLALLGMSAISAQAATDMEKRSIELVNKVIADLGKNRQATLDAINDWQATKNTAYVQDDGQFYPIVCDLNGEVRAHANAKLVGKNMREFKDSDGKLFIAELLDKAKKTNDGYWNTYKFSNPVAKKIQPKHTYCKRSGPEAVCVGYFVNE